MSSLSTLKDYSLYYNKCLQTLQKLYLSRSELMAKTMGISSIRFEPNYGSHSHEKNINFKLFDKLEQVEKRIVCLRDFTDCFEKCLQSTKYQATLPYLLMFILDNKKRNEILPYTNFATVDSLDSHFQVIASDILSDNNARLLHQKYANTKN